MVNTGLNNAFSLVRILSIQNFFTCVHYIIAWFAQISWTPTYHITMPAARRVGPFMNEEPKKPKVNNFVKKVDKIDKLAILCLSRPKLCQKLPKNQPFLPL
jgi:hypothetical protein